MTFYNDSFLFPKLTIIIPVYNAEKYLKQALDSVLSQSFSGFEVIAVNDASKDNSLELLETYHQKDKRIKIIDLKENKGSGYGRNLAIKKAQGDYIVFLDADDFLMPNALRFAQKTLRKKPKASVLVWGFQMCNKKGVPKRAFIPLSPDKKMGETPFQLGLLRRKGFFAFPWIYIVKKSFVKEHQLRFTEGIFFQDIQFTMQALYFAKSVSVIPKACINYRKHVGSVTGNSSVKKIYDKFYAHENIKNFLEEQNTFQFYKPVYEAGYLTYCLFNCIKDFLILPKSKAPEIKAFVMNKLQNKFSEEGLKNLLGIAHSLGKNEKQTKINMFSAYRCIKGVKKNTHGYVFWMRLMTKLNKMLFGLN